eukprot:6652513-Prymnesium_polylepis.1
MCKLRRASARYRHGPCVTPANSAPRAPPLRPELVTRDRSECSVCIRNPQGPLCCQASHPHSNSTAPPVVSSALASLAPHQALRSSTRRLICRPSPWPGSPHNTPSGPHPHDHLGVPRGRIARSRPDPRARTCGRRGDARTRACTRATLGTCPPARARWTPRPRSSHAPYARRLARRPPTEVAAAARATATAARATAAAPPRATIQLTSCPFWPSGPPAAPAPARTWPSARSSARRPPRDPP